MAKLTKEAIEDAVPVFIEVGEGMENGVLQAIVHQGQITKVQELKAGRRRDRSPKRFVDRKARKEE